MNEVRTVTASAAIYNAAGTLLNTYTQANNIISINIQRVGENTKFFGFIVNQRLNLHLLDTARQITINSSNRIVITLTSTEGTSATYPTFFVTEVNRDENTNELSITGYDLLYKANNILVSELTLTKPYTILDFATAAASALGTTISAPSTETCWALSYTNGANFGGSEKLTEAITAVAEATQTICYIDSNNVLTFKRLQPNNAPVQFTKDNYFTFKQRANKRLSKIMSVTELGDNVEAHTVADGSTQYVYDNPFWVLREDLGEVLEDAIERIGGLTIAQTDIKARGILGTSIGDYYSIVCKNNTLAYGYIVDDILDYDGGLVERLQWAFEREDEESTPSNPSSLGEALNTTFARVDKQAQTIDILAQQERENEGNIAAIQLTTDSISSAVKEVRDTTQDNIDAINNLSGSMAALENEVATKVTAQQMDIAVRSIIGEGVDKVTTETGFTFDNSGLSIHKTGSDIETTITENGMEVSVSNTTMLVANSEGVDAKNLHATTYLIIGNNARFEDYRGDRTACFYIGD